MDEHSAILFQDFIQHARKLKLQIKKEIRNNLKLTGQPMGQSGIYAFG